MTPDNLLTVREAASLLAVKPRTIYAWVAARRIPFRKVGRLLRFERAELLTWASVPAKEKLQPEYPRMVG
jgi:excisionase family DNA binding protein